MKTWLCTTEQARLADACAIEKIGIPALVLMENAASSIARHILQSDPGIPVQMVCGPGNNGADGLAVGRILALENHPVTIYAPSNSSTEFNAQKTILSNLGINVLPLEEFVPKDPLIVDALFGSGLSRPAGGIYADLIEAINASNARVYSVDLPSGLHGDQAKPAGPAVKSLLCFALDCFKPAHIKALEYCPQSLCLSIGIPDLCHARGEEIELISSTLASSLLPLRSSQANKGTFGKVLMAAGSSSMSGAAVMAALACFGSGCGTLTLYSPEDAALLEAAKTNLAMVLPAMQNEDGFFAPQAAEKLRELTSRYTHLHGGNGIGTGEGAMEIVRALMEDSRPLVLDADGLNCLSKNMEWLKERENIILTPHLKEFSRLSGASMNDLLERPFEIIRDFSRKYPKAVFAVKSGWTLIARNGRCRLLFHPNPALAKGGSGDVLSGIISGLYAQNLDAFDAARLGVWIHNHAADEAKSSQSFTPMDLIKHLGEAFAKIEH